MVRAKLHIICGNCGSNEFFTFKIDPFGKEIEGDKIYLYKPAVHITCGNCATLHFLSDIMEEKE